MSGLILDDRFVEGEHFFINSNNCFVWYRAKDSKGYAHAKFDGRVRLVHKMLFEKAHGTVPKNLVLDHTCNTRNCINIEHLEPVTNAENGKRGFQRGRKVTGKAAEYIKRREYYVSTYLR